MCWRELIMDHKADEAPKSDDGHEVMDTKPLILIRQFFDEARRAPSNETPFALIKGVLQLDLCVELSLNTIIRVHGTSQHQNKLGGRRDVEWHNLWDIANAVVESKLGQSRSLPNPVPLKTLHETRNLVQHRGSIPSIHDFRAAIEPTRELLELICRELYGLDFERLREWDALQCSPLRQWLSECSNALEKGDPYLAACGCKVAYKRVVRSVRNAAVEGMRPSFSHRFPTRLSFPQVEPLIEQLDEAVIALESEIVAVSIGLSIADHFEFERHLRSVVVHEYMAGNLGLVRNSAWEVDSETSHKAAEFMINYLGRACVMLEAAYPKVFDLLDLPPDKHRSAFFKSSSA